MVVLRGLTLQISEPAPPDLACELKRHRRDHCIWLVRQSFHKALLGLAPKTILFRLQLPGTPKRHHRMAMAQGRDECHEPVVSVPRPMQADPATEPTP